MIQRIQSLYLLLGAAALAVLVFGLRATWQVPAAAAQSWYVPAVTGLGSLTALAALAAIFLNKDRRFPNRMLPGLRLQRRVVVGVQVLAVVFLLVFFVGFYLAQALPRLTDAGGILALGLPVLAYVGFYLARRGIDRDIRELEKAEQFRLRD
ncbi:DUF4293 family protein [Rhodocaloribacter litoris]|uniref:DUF4293 family protein n=1 Tax=Rhodocaloribacter litoris TaxID=2558931 RepID=UPI0014240068|nr:DUF4293 family protein [Rhodocaloribacter litoris]QXD15301.1 DUF4293 family protein [Rhodocaloribacter litoris]